VSGRQWLLQELQLVAEQPLQLLSEAERTEPSELPKLQAEISLWTSLPRQCGHWIVVSLLRTSFSNFRSHELQRYSKIGIPCPLWPMVRISPRAGHR